MLAERRKKGAPQRILPYLKILGKKRRKKVGAG